MKLLRTISFFMIYLIVALSFSLYIPSVEAAEQACCQQTNAGDYCRYTDINDCNPNFLSAPNIYCDNVDYCKTGCCSDTIEGECYTGVAKSSCESNQDSVWNTDPQCNIDQCQLGCCQLSNQCSLATQNKCRATASQYPGVEMIFHSEITDEQSCVNTCRGTEEGACVASDNSCLRTTRADCSDTFQLNKLCSHPDLNTNCAPQQTTNCVGEDVYWFDSCGNQENIYNSNKKHSYNSGFMQQESQAPKAQPNDENLGNCDYITGTLCGEGDAKYGNYVCKDMNCNNVYENSASPNSGGDKKHGESWCVYDTLPGPGTDTVGSRHRKNICLNGEEIVEECRDYREEYCIQNMIGDEKITDVSILELISNDMAGYTEAQCVENNFEDCMKCMGEENLENQQECCSDLNKDCMWIDYGATGILPNEATLKNGACVPMVPPGLKFWETGGEVCGQATQTCKVKYKRSMLDQWTAGSWECVTNCQCDNPEWIKTANEYCRAMGDCGSHFNVEGEAVIGGYMSNSPYKLKITDLGDWNKFLRPENEEWYAWKSKGGNVAGWGLAATATVFAIGFGMAAVGVAASEATFWWSALGTPGSIGGPIVGAIILWIVAIVLVASVLEVSDTKTYTFTCEPWEAPDGGRDCEECNDIYEGSDLEAECTEYRCKSLGKDCQLVNEGTEEQKCVAAPKTDVSSPQIMPGEMDFEITPDPTIPTGFKIKGLVEPFTPVNLKINTDEAAQCKYSTEPLQDYTTMENFGSSSYIFEHEVIIPIPSEATSEEALLATNGGRYELYIKCKDASGNINTKDYSIKFQIDAGPDQTPTSIEKTIPDNGAPTPFGEEEYDIKLLLNEPSDCKWALTDKGYEQMENDFTCAQSSFDISSFYFGLYECNTQLSDLKQNQQNTFYFRCKDKANNIQQESYQYNLVSTPQLQILDPKPSGKIYTRYPILEVTTLQGSNNGEAICSFNENDVSLANMLQMFNTESTEHSQQLQPTTSGVYDYFVKCTDQAGNVAEEVITFELEISLEAAQIYNIYKSEALDILHISTTEDTTCEYSQESFTFGTGTLMTLPDSKEHTTNLGLNVYHIICQDKFNNIQTAVVYP